MKTTSLLSLPIFLLLLPVLVVGCYKLISNHIYHKKDCLEFNIDHIEVRTGINIPKVSFADCDMNDTQTNRKAIYIIDKTLVDIPLWLAKNRFQKTDSLYINKGYKEEHNWIAEFDPLDSKLTIDLIYED